MIEIKRQVLNSHPNVGDEVISACSGSIVTLLGPCGSGKSAFCRGFASLDQPEGYEVKLDQRDITSIPLSERVQKIGYVPSDATLAFSGLKSTLSGELDLTHRMAMPSAPEAGSSINGLIAPLELGNLLERDPFTLSGGEAVRAALALALLKRPSILVLDQIFDQIDPAAVPGLQAAIDDILPESSIIIQTASRQMRGADGLADGQTSPPGVLERSDSFGLWQANVQLRSDARSPDASNASKSPTLGSPNRLASADSPLLCVRGLRFEYPGGGFLLGPLDIEASSGERVALVGPNGVGKTTLLRCLAMLLEPKWDLFEIRNEGRLISPPRNRRMLHQWAKTALYCFQRPEDQLYLGTIREELFASAKLSTAPEALDRAINYAAQLGLVNWLDASPFDTPRSIRRLCLIAGALAAGPPLLLLDEPTVGLDDPQFDALCDLISSEAPKTAIIFVSHDTQFVNRVAGRTIALAKSAVAVNSQPT